jgi:hypothetical protein
MKNHWFLLFLIILLTFGLSIPGCCETGVYEMQPPTFTPQQATQVVQSVRTGAAGALSQIGATQVRPIGPLVSPTAPATQRVLVFGLGADKARATFNEARSRLVIHPELTALQGTPPSIDNTRTIARQFARQNLGLGVEIDNWSVARVTTVAKMGSVPGSAPQEVARTVHFTRTLDGLPVVGPNSALSVTVGPQSQVVGCVRSFLPLTKSTGPAQNMKSRQVLDQELNNKISQLAGRFPGAQLSLQDSKLVYFEQGGKFLQPALMGNVIVKSPGGLSCGLLVTVPALSNPPEPIADPPQTAPAPENTPAPTAPTITSQPPTATTAKVTTPTTIVKPDIPNIKPDDIFASKWMREEPQPEVRFGVYVVRNDFAGWIPDAQGFKNNLVGANQLLRQTYPAAKPVVDYQYTWNFISMWRDVNGANDFSTNYMRKVDIALILGHGANYEISTKGRTEDVIKMDGIPGYGVNSYLGGRTDYVIWKSCSVLPAPVDDGNCWSHYFPIFKGLRGMYGFRNVSYLNDGILEDFAHDIGMGVPLLTAWFDAAEASPCHWYYGDCAVAISPEGLDSQTIYNNNGVANPDKLHMWWQY